MELLFKLPNLNTRNKMKHTNIYKKYMELEHIEREELKRAVMAHGGEFRFFDENREELNGVDYPIIMAGNPDWSSNVDCVITRVAVVDGVLEIYGYDKEYGWDGEMTLDDIALGQIEFIIEAIPETEDVKDVSVKGRTNSLPVVTICREDIEAAGYDPNITDEQFELIAEKIGKYLEWQDFNGQMNDNIKSACEYFDIQKIN